MSGTWMAWQLLPTLEVPPPKRPRAPSPRGRRPGASAAGAGAADAPFEGLEEIEYRPILLLYAVLVRRADASNPPLIVRGRMLDPVEERPGGPAGDGDGRAAFAHGDCVQAAQDQGARGAAMCTAEPCADNKIGRTVNDRWRKRHLARLPREAPSSRGGARSVYSGYSARLCGLRGWRERRR